MYNKMSQQNFDFQSIRCDVSYPNEIDKFISGYNKAKQFVDVLKSEPDVYEVIRFVGLFKRPDRKLTSRTMFWITYRRINNGDN